MINNKQMHIEIGGYEVPLLNAIKTIEKDILPNVDGVIVAYRLKQIKSIKISRQLF